MTFTRDHGDMSDPRDRAGSPETTQPPARPEGVARFQGVRTQKRAIPIETLGGRVISGIRARDDGLATLARVQHGRLSRAQLIGLGYTDDEIQTLIRRRRLHRVHRGVYAVGHVADVALGAEAAALLACGGGAVLSHLTALRIHGLLPLDPSARIDVLVGQRHSNDRRPGILVHRTRWFPRNHVRLVSGLPVTVPERALLDSAPALTNRRLERALEEVLALRTTSLRKVRDMVSCAHGQPGQGLLRALIHARVRPTVTESEAEESFLELIRAAGLPAPQLQASLHGYRVDAYWPEARLAVEIDGFQWHTTKAAFERDRRKQRALQSHGIEVSRITWQQISEEQLELVAHVTRRIVLRTQAAG